MSSQADGCAGDHRLRSRLSSNDIAVSTCAQARPRGEDHGELGEPRRGVTMRTSGIRVPLKQWPPNGPYVLVAQRNWKTLRKPVGSALEVDGVEDVRGHPKGEACLSMRWSRASASRPEPFEQVMPGARLHRERGASRGGVVGVTRPLLARRSAHRSRKEAQRFWSHTP
jgi:hypothetical protein